MVIVLDKYKKPLGVCSEQRARQLIEQRRACVYAYTAILRQLAAKYNNEELHAQIQILLSLYEDVTAPDFDVDNLDVVHNKLDELRICIFNLHVITVNGEHRDLQPVCIYLSDLIHQVKAALGEEDDEPMSA